MGSVVIGNCLPQAAVIPFSSVFSIVMQGAYATDVKHTNNMKVTGVTICHGKVWWQFGQC